MRMKRLLAIGLAVLSISAVGVTAMAAELQSDKAEQITQRYIDGDREVKYIRIDWVKDGIFDKWEATESVIKKRYNDRNWVVSINEFTNLKNSVGYSVGIYESGVTVTSTIWKKGTGNYGGSYNGNCANLNLVLMAERNNNETRGAEIAGQWSPDAAK